MLGKFQEMTINFTADQPGLSLSIATCRTTWTTASWRCSTAGENDGYRRTTADHFGRQQRRVMPPFGSFGGCCRPGNRLRAFG